MKTNLQKLNKIASTRKSNWEAKAKTRKANESWLDVSFKIAIEVLDALKAREMSQVELARLINVTPQQISKIVKGQENLTIGTILKLQNALSIKLLPSTKWQRPILKRFEHKFSHTFQKIAVDVSRITTAKIVGKTYDYKGSVKAKRNVYTGQANSGENDLAMAA